jgi:hypothetical protein
MNGLELRSGKLPLDTSPDKFGYLRRSPELLAHPELTLQRIEEDGYAYIPGFHDVDVVTRARRVLLEALNAEGVLDPAYPVMDGVAKPGLSMPFRPDIANSSADIQNLVYSSAAMAWFDNMLGEPALHYEFTWLRVIGKGQGTWPHCDIVYMGRGTRNLYTMWTPLGTVPLNVGGLIVLENSHRQSGLHDTYGTLDVDVACSNEPGKNQVEAGGFHRSGAIDINPVKLRDTLGGRWLTSEEYQMGDALIFGMNTVHASLDNQTDTIRLSTDTRYQRASDPVDERWVGEVQGHDMEKREKIC